MRLSKHVSAGPVCPVGNSLGEDVEAEEQGISHGPCLGKMSKGCQ